MELVKHYLLLWKQAGNIPDNWTQCFAQKEQIFKICTFIIFIKTCVSLLLCLTLCDPMNIRASGLPCPSISPGILSNSCDWVSGAIQPSHLTHLSLFLLPSIFPSNRVFSSELALHIRWLGTEASASASVFLMKILGWFPLGLTGLFSLQSKYFQVSSPAPQFKNISSFALSQLPHPYMTTGKTIVWLCRPLSEQWCLCFLICYLSFS